MTRLARLLLSAAIVTAACGAPLPHHFTQTSAPEMEYPAAHPSAPQVVSEGGRVIASPRIVPVYFGNDDAGTVQQITTFLQALAGSRYWTAVTHEYGVGSTSVAPPVQLDEAMSGVWSSSAIESWLTDALSSKLPAPDANTVYVLHFPASAALVFDGLPSCDAGGLPGYHSSVSVGGLDVPYVALARCESSGGLSGFDAITSAESHLLIGAVVDPAPSAAPAYDRIDFAHLFWMQYSAAGSPLQQTEPPDVCAHVVGPDVRSADLPYMVQRSWSNAAAAAGADPCVPGPADEVYFAAAPLLPDQMPAGDGAMSSVNVAPGQSKTIDVVLFSDGPTAPWTVEAHDFSYLLGGPQRLKLTLDRSTGKNGDVLHLTITPNGPAPAGGSLFVVTSRLGSRVNTWVGVAGP